MVEDDVVEDTVGSRSIVENTAGSDGVVVEDDVIEDTVGSSSIVENTACSDGVVVEDDVIEDTVGSSSIGENIVDSDGVVVSMLSLRVRLTVVVLLRIQLAVMVLWLRIPLAVVCRVPYIRTPVHTTRRVLFFSFQFSISVFQYLDL